MKRNGHRSLESSASDSGRATLTNPRVLMPDEPCEGLATLVVRDVRDVRDAIVALNREGMAIVPVEQKLSIPLASRHRICVVDHGTIAWSGSTADLRADRARIEPKMTV